MEWFIVRIVELIAGTFLFWWARRRVLKALESLRTEKHDLGLPVNDAIVAHWWFWGRGFGLALGLAICWLTYPFFKLNSIAAILIFATLGEYFAEFLGQQPIPKGHPWRAAVDDMAARLGIASGEVRYRQCSEWAPYAGIGGITLPSRALRELDDSALRFAVVGALITRQRHIEWIRLGYWALIGIAASLFFVLMPASLGDQVFFGSVSFLFSIAWALYTPVRVRAKNSARLDILVLQHTGDFDAACLAIKVMDTDENATKRIQALRTWWDAYQQGQVVVIPEPAQTQVQTLGQKP